MYNNSSGCIVFFTHLDAEHTKSFTLFNKHV